MRPGIGRNAMRTMLATSVIMVLTGAAAQPGGGTSAEIKQKVAALKQSVAANQQRLRKYQWTEVQQLTLKGESKPQQQFMCQYGPDGQVEKYPMGPQEQPSGGRLKQRLIAKKKAEMQDYMAGVKSLLAMYIPPNPQKMQQAVGTHDLSLSPDAALGIVNLTFTNYEQPGDQMVIAVDTTGKRISTINVNTYMGEARDRVDLDASFSTLPDGTNHVEKTVLDVAAKEMVVTTLNTSYHILGETGAVADQNREPPVPSNGSTNYPGQGTPETIAELQSLVAPIALYPDALVAQILNAATFPDQVAVADNWMQQNKDLTGSALGTAVNGQT